MINKFVMLYLLSITKQRSGKNRTKMKLEK
nr:MAG TPA: hypothetical protein [Caudoviricetes sp.]